VTILNTDASYSDNTLELHGYAHIAWCEPTSFQYSNVSTLSDAYIPFHPDAVPVIALDITVWGDYVGDSVTRSNHRDISELGYRVVKEWSLYPGSGCLLTLDAQSVRFVRARRDAHLPTHVMDVINEMRERYDALAESGTTEESWSTAARERFDVFETLHGLCDYPLINDETLCTIEDEIRRDDWTSYVWNDVQREALTLATDDDADADTEPLEAAFDGADENAVFAWALTNSTAHGWNNANPPEVESAISAVWKITELASEILYHFANTGALPVPDRQAAMNG
jgi:hypothetical protein